MKVIISRNIRIVIPLLVVMVYFGGVTQTNSLTSPTTHVHITPFTFSQALHDEKIVIFDSPVDEQERVGLRTEDGVSNSGQLLTNLSLHVHGLYILTGSHLIPRFEQDVVWQQKTTSL